MIRMTSKQQGITHLVRKQIFRKTNIFFPLIRTHRLAYKRNSFSEHFENVLNE